MPGPQSMVFFGLLLAVFGALMWWQLRSRLLALRIIAACLAFVPAMVFGVAAVNKYFDYYQTWNAAIEDVTNQGVPAVSVAPAIASAAGHPRAGATPGAGLSRLTGRYINSGLARQLGLTLRLTVRGQLSKITRTVYVFLPPQYFWPGPYQQHPFPAIELLHGYPGQPQDWITVLGVNSTLNSLVGRRAARPAVLVMPDTNGGRGVSLQCLNQVRGPQDATFLGRDLPGYIAAALRVQQPGTGWGVAGYSEGGFCAANLGLQDSRVFSYAGVLSGYFQPSTNRLKNPARRISPFGGNAQLARLNTPFDFVQAMPAGHPVPQFWLGAGVNTPADVRNAQYFGQLVQLRQPAVTIRLVAGGHAMSTWRQLLPPMLSWMTRGLAQQTALYNSPAAEKRRAAIAGVARVRRLHQQRARHSSRPAKA